ncbi:MAG: hypothetical protein K6B40_02015 [Firmicutes bacterium]|nr:hypothetical protein [Bacillota bacterium]
MKRPDKKNLFLLLLAAFAMVLAVFFVSQQFFRKADLDSVKAALSRLQQEDAYRFSSTARVTAEDKQREYYQVEGEISGQNRHISGQVLGTELEIYYVDGSFWQKSAADAAFQKIDAGELEKAVAFAAELEPAAMLDFDQVQTWSFEGREIIDGSPCRKVTLSQARAGGWVGRYFDRVSYTFWLERGTDRLCQGEVQASSLSGDILFHAVLHFSDYGKEISIAPPQ